MAEPGHMVAVARTAADKNGKANAKLLEERKKHADRRVKLERTQIAVGDDNQYAQITEKCESYLRSRRYYF